MPWITSFEFPRMSWLRRIWRRGPALSEEHARALAVHRRRPPIDRQTRLDGARWVVVDVETTGLDVQTDRLISIGAVEVEGAKVRLNRSFEVIFRQPAASERNNILIHGIDGTTQLTGVEPARAMLEFLDFAGPSPRVGFHADFDRIMIQRAGEAFLGDMPLAPWLDLAYLAPALLAKSGGDAPHSLDDWAARFGITNPRRHNALADALATAQLLQIVLSQAPASGARTIADLIRIERDQRWLARR